MTSLKLCSYADVTGFTFSKIHLYILSHILYNYWLQWGFINPKQIFTKASRPPGGSTLIFSIYIGWADFLGGQNFLFQYFLGFSAKFTNFLCCRFLWIFFGVISNFNYFYGLFTKINNCYLCFLVNLSLYTSQLLLNMMGKVHFILLHFILTLYFFLL